MAMQTPLLSAVRSLTDLVSWLGHKILGLRELRYSASGKGGGGGLGGGAGPSLGNSGGSLDGADLLSGLDEDLDWFRQAYAQDVQKNFQESRSSAGVAWAPLKWRSGRALILTGVLMHAAVAFAAQSVTRVPGGVQIAFQMSEPSYWSYHQSGTAKIPARPFLGPRGETVAELQHRIGQRIAVNLVH